MAEHFYTLHDDLTVSCDCGWTGPDLLAFRAHSEAIYRTVFAPPRGQVSARPETLPPLPDPFQDEEGE